MAAVVKAKGKSVNPLSTVDEKKPEGNNKVSTGASQLSIPLLSKIGRASCRERVFRAV